MKVYTTPSLVAYGTLVGIVQSSNKAFQRVEADHINDCQLETSDTTNPDDVCPTQSRPLSNNAIL